MVGANGTASIFFGVVVLIGAVFFAALIWARLPVVRTDPFWDPQPEVSK